MRHTMRSRAADAKIHAMTPGGKFITLDDKLYNYMLAHGHNDDSVLRDLIRETQEKLGQRAGMQIAPEQGTFMTLLARAIGARRAIEVGTFTGYSAICIARGLAADGSLLCCDVSEEWTAIARRYWEKAGVAGRITLKLAPALDTLRALPSGADVRLRLHRRRQDQLSPLLRGSAAPHARGRVDPGRQRALERGSAG